MTELPDLPGVLSNQTPDAQTSSLSIPLHSVHEQSQIQLIKFCMDVLVFNFKF